MKISLITCSLVAFTLQACYWTAAQARKLHLGSCTVNIHTYELRHHFHHIQQGMISGDEHKAIRLLKKDVMKNLQDTESCCFLKQLLHFYMDKVFSSYTSGASLHRRTTSVLANSFHGISKDLRACHAKAHCECTEGARLKFDHIQNTYNKLDHSAAALKAIGELDSLFEWLEGFQHH